jgi:hypothetical protein
MQIDAQAQMLSINWDQTYGGNSRDWNCVVTTDQNGNQFLIGDTRSGIDGDKSLPLCPSANAHSDIWLLKLDSSGNIIWQRNYGGDGDESSPRLIPLNNASGELLFTCYTTSGISCDKSEPNRDTIPIISADYWIVLLDSNGVIIWEKTLGGDNYDDYNHIAILSTGEIVVAGESNSPVGYDKTVPNYSISNDFWVVKLDPNGNKLADFVYGGDGGEFIASIIPDNNGGFLLAGSTNSDVSGDVSEPGQGNFDYWMIKIDDQGNKLWDKRFGGSGPDRCNHAVATSDGGYLLTGFTVSPAGGDVSEPPKGTQDYWVVKTDAGGNMLWDRRYGGEAGSFATFASQTSDDGYWLAGYTSGGIANDVSEASYGGSDYWLVRTDPSGNKLYDYRFGGGGNDFCTGLSIISDSTFLAFGYSDSGSSSVKTAASKGWFDYWLIQFGVTDTTTSLPELTSGEMSLKIFPNPASEKLYIELSGVTAGVVFISLYDVTGRLLLNKKQKYSESGLLKSVIDVSWLNSGYYFVSVDSGDNIINTILSITR